MENCIHSFGIHVAKVKFDAEFGGVDQFLQKGARNAHFRPFAS